MIEEGGTELFEVVLIIVMAPALPVSVKVRIVNDVWSCLLAAAENLKPENLSYGISPLVLMDSPNGRISVALQPVL